MLLIPNFRFISFLLIQTNSCPLCRSEMKTDDEDYEQQKHHKQREAQRAEDIDMLHNSMYG